MAIFYIWNTADYTVLIEYVSLQFIFYEVKKQTNQNERFDRLVANVARAMWHNQESPSYVFSYIPLKLLFVQLGNIQDLITQNQTDKYIFISHKFFNSFIKDTDWTLIYCYFHQRLFWRFEN